MAFVVEDPFVKVTKREVPADLKDRSAGSFTLLLRTVPFGKFKALIREMTR